MPATSSHVTTRSNPCLLHTPATVAAARLTQTNQEMSDAIELGFHGLRQRVDDIIANINLERSAPNDPKNQHARILDLLQVRAQTPR